MWYQHESAPANFAINIRQYLDADFPNRWIGRCGTIEWPPHSPDLNPLDFFLWGYVNDSVYKTRPNTLSELQQRIIDTIQAITPKTLSKVRETFAARIAHCLAVGGAHFEHLL